jgi:hypothetical protein
MTPERFRRITEAYGASPARWPPEERDDALALVNAGNADALAALADARALDGLLDAHTIITPDAAFARRIADSSPTRPARAFWRRPRIWFSGAGFVGAGAAGVVAGALLVSLLAPASPPGETAHGGSFEQSWPVTAFGRAPSDWSDQ